MHGLDSHACGEREAFGVSSGGRGGRERRCVCVKRVECVLRVLARRACDGQFLRRVLVCEESVEKEWRENIAFDQRYG